MDYSANLPLYHIFYTVAKTGSFSGAAGALFISQPAVSKSIQKLEQALDAQLFYRNSKGVTLTDSGKLLYSQLAVAFQAIEQGEQQVLQYQKLGMGRIQIGVSSTLCKYMLLPYLHRYTLENPNIQVNVICHSSTSTLEALHQGQLDMGLIASPDIFKEDYFHYLQEIHYIFATTPTYLKNLNRRGFHTEQDILENGNIMLLNKENASRQHIEAYIAGQHLAIGTPMEINNMVLITDFTKIGLGIGCVIKEFVQEDLLNKTLVEIPLSTPIPARKVGFVFHKERYDTLPIRQFRKLL